MDNIKPKSYLPGVHEVMNNPLLLVSGLGRLEFPRKLSILEKEEAATLFSDALFPTRRIRELPRQLRLNYSG